jgi:hypothetical protein
MSTQLAVMPGFGWPVPDTAQEFARLLDPAFLAEAGWDALRLVLCPLAKHPQLGRRPCVVSDCGAPSSRAGQLCMPCSARHRASGLALQEFAAIPHTPPCRGRAVCGSGLPAPVEDLRGSAVQYPQQPAPVLAADIA